ncbi:DUF421 domain-containing protein [Priestia megaterium]|nr:DUF421 domain-containing protein [Priestia megaterium]
MDLAKEMFILLGRILTILPLMLFVTLFMGRRSIGELPVFDFLVLMALGAIVGADIAEPKVEHLHTAVAVILIGIFQKSVAYWKIKYRRLGKRITFKPIIVINEGKFVIENLKKIRYSIDNVLYMLREKDVFDISTVQIAIIESNGKLTVKKKSNKEYVTVEDLDLKKDNTDFAYPLIIEGTIYPDVLLRCNQTEQWLKEQLLKKGITDIKSIFFASINEQGDLHISLSTDTPFTLPPLHH